MPIPNPNKKEKKSDYYSRVYPMLKKEGKDDDQIKAIIEQKWKDKNKSVGSNTEAEICCHGKGFDSVKINVASYDPRTQKFQGRDYIIVPCVMLTEGVHNGSNGPVYYPADEIAKFPAAWNGVPVPLYHPEQDGYAISANSPDVLEQWNLGYVFNTRTSDGGKKLVSELWLDIEILSAKDPDLLKRINNKEQIEVSTGLYYDDDETAGTWNNEDYMAIARNFRPDHLAILPDALGACSTKDGCGIRANSDKDSVDYKSLWSGIVANKDLAMSDIVDMARSAVYAKDKDNSWHYVRKVYKDYLIYMHEIKSGVRYYKEGYKIEDNSIILDGQPQEVIETITYKPVTNKEEKQMDREKTIDFLVANGCRVPKDQLEKLEDSVLSGMKETIDDAQEYALSVQNSQKEKTIVIEKDMTVDDIVGKLPDDMKATINRAIARDKKDHADMVAYLVANQKAYAKEDLEAMKIDQLEKIKMIVDESKPKDYTMQGAPVTHGEQHTEEPLMSPSLFDAKDK